MKETYFFEERFKISDNGNERLKDIVNKPYKIRSLYPKLPKYTYEIFDSYCKKGGVYLLQEITNAAYLEQQEERKKFAYRSASKIIVPELQECVNAIGDYTGLVRQFFIEMATHPLKPFVGWKYLDSDPATGEVTFGPRGKEILRQLCTIEIKGEKGELLIMMKELKSGWEKSKAFQKKHDLRPEPVRYQWDSLAGNAIVLIDRQGNINFNVSLFDKL
jgi:hypothetical protein